VRRRDPGDGAVMGCLVPGCPRAKHRRGLCYAHYRQGVIDGLPLPGGLVVATVVWRHPPEVTVHGVPAAYAGAGCHCDRCNHARALAWWYRDGPGRPAPA